MTYMRTLGVTLLATMLPGCMVIHEREVVEAPAVAAAPVPTGVRACRIAPPRRRARAGGGSLMLSVAIRNATIVDGAGAPGRMGDIGIADRTPYVRAT